MGPSCRKIVHVVHIVHIVYIEDAQERAAARAALACTAMFTAAGRAAVRRRKHFPRHSDATRAWEAERAKRLLARPALTDGGQSQQQPAAPSTTASVPIARSPPPFSFADFDPPLRCSRQSSRPCGSDRETLVIYRETLLTPPPFLVEALLIPPPFVVLVVLPAKALPFRAVPPSKTFLPSSGSSAEPG